MGSDHESSVTSTPELGDHRIARLLANHVSAILWTTDQVLMVTSITGGGLAAFGKKPDEGVGKTLFEYFGTEDRSYPPLAAHLNALQGQFGDYQVDYGGRTFYSRVEPMRGKDGLIVGVIGLGLDMTDTIKVQSALRDSEERFRSLFEKSPIGIGIAYKGTMRYVNSALVQLFRYDTPAALLGKSVMEHIAPRYRDEIRRRIESRERGQPWSDSFETVGIRKDGSEFTYHLDVARIRLPEGDGSVAFITDITERVEAQEALRKAHEELEKRVEKRTAELAQANRNLQNEVDERRRSEAALLLSEEKFRDLAENIKEVFWLVNSESKEILYISPGYAQIWGKSCQSLYEKPMSWVDAVHPEDRKRVTEAQSRQKEGLYDEEYRLLLPDGRVRWIHDRAFPVRNSSGAVYRIAGVAEDITERKRLESEIRQAMDQSRLAYKELQGAQSQLVRTEKLASIGMLVSGVAHEINNPLNVIYGNLNLLEEAAIAARRKGGSSRSRKRGAPPPPDPRKTRLMLRDALRSAERARSIIETFRDFARDTRWAEPVCLNECLEKTVAVIRRQLPAAITVIQKLRAIPKIQCFRGQMTQVFLNLIQNAIEAIEGKGKIVLRSSKKGNHVLIEVEDTGKGMPPEVKKRLFEPFFTTKGIGQGLGLGLSVSAMIVHNHGGEIQVDSTVGKGTRFQIQLPITKSSEAS
jgi:PAS domain S-box-containing protein